MESDREKYDRLSGRLGQVFGPGQIFFPGPLVQSVQENDGFVALFFSGRGKNRIIKYFIFLDMVVGDGTEFGRGKLLLEFVYLAGTYCLRKTKGSYFQTALFQACLFIVRKKAV